MQVPGVLPTTGATNTDRCYVVNVPQIVQAFDDSSGRPESMTKGVVLMRTLHRSLFLGLALSITAYVAAAQDIPGPKVGEPFPHTLSAPDQDGQMQSLDALMGEKGVVVVFVRSADWCPYCQRQLADLNERLPEFAGLGLNVVSVSVDQVEHTAAFAAEHQIRYKMLADPAGDINRDIGIRDEQYPVGSKAFGVPRPALYVIDTAGAVRARYMEPTYRTRPNLDTVLSDAAALSL
jgi:peroxiredoxin